jgi:hypothetical protein
MVAYGPSVLCRAKLRHSPSYGIVGKEGIWPFTLEESSHFLLDYYIVEQIALSDPEELFPLYALIA